MVNKILQTQELMVNMGPQHPSTHGVLRLLVTTDGEVVTNVKPILGYLHRCKEKIAEKITYPQYVPYTDRLDYVSACSNNLAYCLTVEKALKLEVPLRAQYIRIIVAELTRISSHLIAFGTYGLDVGAITPFLYAFREREVIMNLFEYLCGSRLTCNYVRIGGVARDIDKKFVDDTTNFLNIFENKIKDYNDLLSYNRIFSQRTKGIGIIPLNLAIKYGLTGPNLRASGLPLDIRKTKPYSSYDKIQFDVPIGKNGIGIVGDCWNRYFVRIEEMIQSAKIIRRALSALPTGPFASKVPRIIKPPKCEVYESIENPRGELGFYLISDNSDKPFRLKIRAPSFSNLSILEEIGKGVLIADLIAILGSLDIVLGEIDR